MRYINHQPSLFKHITDLFLLKTSNDRNFDFFMTVEQAHLRRYTYIFSVRPFNNITWTLFYRSSEKIINNQS